MIDTLVQFSNGVCVSFAFPIEQVFAYNIRFQILCDTDEQRDYLWALQLMYNREVDIRTWAEWNARPDSAYLGLYEEGDQLKIETAKPPLLPIYFCTSVQRHD